MNPGELKQVVGVHVGNPLLKLRPEFAPDGNAAGGFLLWRLLELALLAEGLAAENSCGFCGGQLNDCVVWALTSNAQAAAETFKRELKPLCLLEYCQIGVWDGESWHCVYPSSGVRLNWLMDNERLEYDLQKFRKASEEQFAIVRRAAEELLRERQEGK